MADGRVARPRRAGAGGFMIEQPASLPAWLVLTVIGVSMPGDDLLVVGGAWTLLLVTALTTPVAALDPPDDADVPCPSG